MCKINEYEIFSIEQGDNEMGNDFGAGTGDAFKAMNIGGSDGSNSRRKRSTMRESAVLKSIFRSKRQTEWNDEAPTAVVPKEPSVFQHIKEQFDRIMDVAQEMFHKIQQIGRSNNEAA